MSEAPDLVDRWLINFASPNTKRQYKYWFNKFTEYSKHTPEDLIEKTLTREGLLQVDHQTKQFHTKLVEDGYPKGTAATALAVVRSFFTHNAQRLPRLPSAFIPPSEPAFEQRHSLTDEEYKKMLNSTDNPFHKLILMLLADGGQRKSILTALKLKHIKSIEIAINRIQVNTVTLFQVPSELQDPHGNNVNKGRVAYRFAVTPETTNALIEQLKKRKRLTDEDWLLAERAIPLYPEKIRRIVTEAAHKAKIQRTVESVKLGKVAAIHPHIFRGYLNERLKQAGVTDDVLRNMILGHRPPYGGAYDRYPDEQIKEVYAKL